MVFLQVWISETCSESRGETSDLRLTAYDLRLPTSDFQLPMDTELFETCLPNSNVVSLFCSSTPLRPIQLCSLIAFWSKAKNLSETYSGQLLDCEQSLFCSRTCGKECKKMSEHDIRRASRVRMRQSGELRGRRKTPFGARATRGFSARARGVPLVYLAF